MAIEPAGEAITLTENGRSALERLRAARKDDLREFLDGWSPEEHPELDDCLRTLACDSMDDDAARVRPDESVRAAA